MPQAFGENPVEAFKRNVYVSPFHEDDLGRSPERSAPTTSSSDRTTRTRKDWPSPCSYVDHLPKSFSQEDVEKIMGGNLARIMRVGVTV